MIKWALPGAAAVVVLAFGAGAYVGWKTTMTVLDVVEARRKKSLS